MRHTITEKELREWIRGHWRQYAASFSEFSNKRLMVGPDGYFEVLVDGDSEYLGRDIQAAIRFYNNAP